LSCLYCSYKCLLLKPCAFAKSRQVYDGHCYYIGLAQTVYIRSTFVLSCAKISKYTGYLYDFGEPYYYNMHSNFHKNVPPVSLFLLPSLPASASYSAAQHPQSMNVLLVAPS